MRRGGAVPDTLAAAKRTPIAQKTEVMITLLDYGAGNVRSVINALESLGERVEIVARAEDISSAERLVFPGVGAFGSMMQILDEKSYVEPLRAYLRSGRPFLGICMGLQALFESSEEAPGLEGLGFLAGSVKRFRVDLAVPQIGWNGVSIRQPSRIFNGLRGDEKFYFVHSYHVAPTDDEVVLTTTDYGYSFASSIQKGNVIATQFHPEKSGNAGLRILKNFLETDAKPLRPSQSPRDDQAGQTHRRLPGCSVERPGRPGGDQGRPVRRQGRREPCGTWASRWSWRDATTGRGPTRSRS